MPSLAHQRCLNHAQREAVARCPSCAHYFCRECITEHDDKVICAGCLAKIARKPAVGLRTLAGVRYAAGLAAAVLLAWFFFYLVGSALLSAPSRFHDGTLWKTSFRDEP